ncbi:MAG: hypothetical protein CVV50_05675, partial [Spirochaetae bacterium HGW-Spirochaetae-6]
SCYFILISTDKDARFLLGALFSRMENAAPELSFASFLWRHKEKKTHGTFYRKMLLLQKIELKNLFSLTKASFIIKFLIEPYHPFTRRPLWTKTR